MIRLHEPEKAGLIAAVDPKTGEAFYGNSIVEAVKLGRKTKNDPVAVFFFVKVGYPLVQVIKKATIQGQIEDGCFPIIKAYIDDTQH